MPEEAQIADQKASKETLVKTPHKINWIHILIGVVLGAGLLGAGFGVYLLTQSQSESTNEPNQVSTSSAKQATPSATATPSADKDETADWKTYTNPTYNLSFKYPTEWSIKEETKDSVTLKSDNPNVEFVMYKSDVVITSIKPYKIVSTEKVRILGKDTEKNLLEDDPSVFPTASRPIRDRGVFVQIEKDKDLFVISSFYEKNNQSMEQLFDLILKTLNFE